MDLSSDVLGASGTAVDGERAGHLASSSSNHMDCEVFSVASQSERTTQSSDGRQGCSRTRRQRQQLDTLKKEKETSFQKLGERIRIYGIVAEARNYTGCAIGEIILFYDQMTDVDTRASIHLARDALDR